MKIKRRNFLSSLVFLPILRKSKLLETSDDIIAPPSSMLRTTRSGKHLPEDIIPETYIVRLFDKYMLNIAAYYYNGDNPDERLMRAIEEKIDIPECYAHYWRENLVKLKYSLEYLGRKFNYNSDPRLKKALKCYAFEYLLRYSNLSL